MKLIDGQAELPSLPQGDFQPICGHRMAMGSKWTQSGSEVIPPSRNIVEKEVECPQDLVQLPHSKACLDRIIQGVKATGSNTEQLSSIQLRMLLLEKVSQLDVDNGAIHTD